MPIVVIVKVAVKEVPLTLKVDAFVVPIFTLEIWALIKVVERVNVIWVAVSFRRYEGETLLMVSAGRLLAADPITVAPPTTPIITQSAELVKEVLIAQTSGVKVWREQLTPPTVIVVFASEPMSGVNPVIVNV